MDAFVKISSTAIPKLKEPPIAQCLQQAVDQGSLSGDIDPAELADFIVNSWQGALIALKVRNTAEPLLTFEKYVFEHLLKPECPAEQEPEKTGS